MTNQRMYFEAFHRNNWTVSLLWFIVFFIIAPYGFVKILLIIDWNPHSIAPIIYLICSIIVWILAGICASVLTGDDGGYNQFNEVLVCLGYISLIIIIVKGTITGFYDSSSPSRLMNS